MPRLHFAGCVSFTFILLLFSPLQLPFKAVGIEPALAQTQTPEQRNQEALRLYDIGKQQLRNHQFQEALETFQQVLVIVREIKQPYGEATTLHSIGLVYEKLGQYQKALESYQQALAIAQDIGDKNREGVILNNIGIIYKSLGQYLQAVERYQQALKIAQEIGDKTDEGTIFNNLGLVYYNLGQYGQALEFYQQALGIHQALGNQVSEGTILGNIGTVYLSLGEYNKALEYSQQALAIHQLIGNKETEGSILGNIGIIYLHLGKYDNALEYSQQALVIHQAVGNKVEEGTVLNNIGSVYDILEKTPQALEFYQQALVIAQDVGDKVGEARTLNNIGLSYKLQGQYAQAETALLAAIEVLEILRDRDLADEEKISIFETQAFTYRFLQEVLIGQGQFEKALEIAERSRGRALVELLDSKFSNKTRNQLDIQPPSLAEIQQIASQQKATLVQYSIIKKPVQNKGREEWIESKLYIWVISPTGIVTFKQVDLDSLKTSLADLVNHSRDLMGVRSRSIGVVERTNIEPADPTEQLKQLHNILIAPIADVLPTDPSERVIFIPQASLFLVPFPALIDEKEQYLVEKHTILTAPSIQVLALTRQQKQSIQNSSKEVLVVGNPTMPQIKLGDLEMRLDPLPGAEKEAIEISRLFNTNALTGSQATKATVMQKMQQSGIIHLATHGLLDDFKGFGIPGAIALAPSGKSDNSMDGLLTASEIFDLNLSQTELVVLSACDTGRGDITGDGVIGLSRALIAAGTPSVLVSLWSVNDKSTAFLMTQFYQNFKHNSDKAIALRQAMLTTLKEYPNPLHWSAFTLIGEAE
jgi:CHAT domain-containing protein/tetratricopeptide (TPR) repeat protein